MKKRGARPTPTFQDVFEGSIQGIAADFLKSKSFKHAGTKGSEREIPVQEFFNEHLPSVYQVAKGEAVDLRNRKSPQLDVMIYDQTRNYAFYSGESQILPAEALLASVEVKSLLTREEIKKSLRAALKLRKLRPFKMNLSEVRQGGEAADERARYFHTLFAYETDLAKTDWLSEEFARMTNVAKELSVDVAIIDRVYVAHRGTIHPGAPRGIIEPTESGLGLMHFYMHIWNFLTRENARRKPAPYMDYAGRLTRGWKKL